MFVFIRGWQTLIKAKDTDPSIYKVPLSNIPLSAYLGAVGMPGRTAYFGRIKWANLKKMKPS